MVDAPDQDVCLQPFLAFRLRRLRRKRGALNPKAALLVATAPRSLSRGLSRLTQRCAVRAGAVVCRGRLVEGFCRCVVPMAC